VGFLLVDSTPFAVVVGGVAGWNIMPVAREAWETGSARCWVLRRHLAGGGVFFLVAASGPGCLTHPLCPWCGVGGCGGGVGFGVWWCVECCIVDASIFLCLVLWFVRVCCV
jgi:hypothetical protein